MRYRSVALVVAAALLKACSGSEPSSVHDTELATLERAPTLVLVGTDEHPLYGVVGGELLNDRIALANSGSREVHIYGMDGRLLRVSGRQGAGPGEFSTITWMQQADGHLFVYDGQLNRVTELNDEGEFLGSVNLHDLKGYLGIRALGVFADRSVLVHGGMRQKAAHSVPITYRDTFALLRYDRIGHFHDSVGTSVWNEKYAERWGRGGQIYLDRPLGRRSAIAVRGWEYYVVENNDATIAVYDTGGAPVRVMLDGSSRLPRLASDAEVSVARERLSTRFPKGVDVGDISTRVPIPDTLPPYGWEGNRQLPVLRVGQDGAVWVLEFGGLDAEGPVWTVLRPDGTVKARVAAEEEVEILCSTDDLALVRRWDSLDAESVSLHRILWRPARE